MSYETNYNHNDFKETSICEFDFKMFFEKIKILNDLEKTGSKVKQCEKDAAFIKALKPLLSSRLQVKADEAVRMLPFFSIVQVLKRTEVV